MTTFVHCRGCGLQIHETAPTCPKCGAPQMIVSTASVPVGAKPASATAPAYTSYDQVPWYRKRWFAVLCMLLFVPAFLVIAFTGEVYYVKKGQLATFPKSARMTFLILTVGWIVLALLR